MKRTHKYRIDETFEALGSNLQITVDGYATVELWPGEKQTWDYPGAPPSAEILEWVADAFEGYDAELELVYRVTRKERPDWFAWLDKIMLRKVQDAGREDHYLEQASEIAKDEDRFFPG